MEYVDTKIVVKPENIKAFGKIVTVASDNILADASQIWDSTQGKFQSEINATGGGKGGIDPESDITFSGNNIFSGDNTFVGDKVIFNTDKAVNFASGIVTDGDSQFGTNVSVEGNATFNGETNTFEDGFTANNDCEINGKVTLKGISNTDKTKESNTIVWNTNGGTTDLTTYAKLDALEEGVFAIDSDTNIGLQYTEDGLDAAKVSDHFKSLLTSNEEETDLTPMYLGKFDQGTINSTTGYNDNKISYTTYRAVSKDVLAVPFIGCTFTIKAPEGYSIQFYYNPKLNMWPYTLAAQSEWLKNGDTFTMPNEPDNGTTPKTAIQFKLNIKCDEGSNFNLKSVQNLVDNGDIALLYKGSDVFLDHIHQEDRAKNVSAYQTTYQLENVGNIPFFGFLTDIHSDVVRYERFLKYCDYLGVNAAILGGDYTISNATDGFTYLHDIASKYNTKVLPVVGNHDGWEYDTRSIYNMFLKDFGYGATYYYQDIHNIRIIVLNPYETTDGSYTNEAIGQDQMDWFIETLRTTPSNYGILLCYHRPDGALTEDSNYTKFFTESTNAIDPPTSVTGIQHIIKVVDAYMLSSSISGSYESSTGTVDYEADFTSVTSPAEFIAHVTGHFHKDLVGYYSGTANKQLVINTVCGNGYSPQHCFSFIRDGRGPSQDGMTFFGINRTLGTVMIARIGADIDVDGKTHDIMYIPYK